MGKGWSLPSGSCSQKGQEEECSLVGITEKWTEVTKPASSPPRPRPLLQVTTPSKGGQAGTARL